MNTEEDLFFLQKTIEIAHKNIDLGGGPFGAVIVENSKIISESGNQVRIINDPTAHAEVQAIRIACKKINSYSLENCTIYCSCEPCPMCLGAIYWAKISRIVFAASRNDAAQGGFDDNKIYLELAKNIQAREIPTTQIQSSQAKNVFTTWIQNNNKLEY